MHSEVDPGGNRTEERKRIKGSEWKADTVYDAQPWKEKRPDCVQVLTWVVLHIEHGQWGPLQHHLFPPLLTLLDDYEPRYKTVGAHLVRHAIVKNCSPMDVRRTGLGDVFFDALLPLLTYHSELELLKEALPCIVELVPVLEPKDSRPYYSKLERILQDGILLGLSFAIGGKIETIRVILSAIPPLISLLGLASVRFMKRLLGVSCDVLELHVHDVPTQIIAAQVIVRIETECWPRMAVYRGMTMKAAATAWRGAKDNDSADADTLRVLLKSIVSALKEICGELVEPDLRLLRRIDPRMFEDLIPL
ncbi:hypothetical protein HKX48_004654 [Thoreauomyces humboldtii]|nr:hypothetical protein HKX48_004654 [Thoreauomyces humboldtii]